jgi:hypothetical protein
MFYNIGPCGLYYKPITIVNDDSTVINKLETSLTDDARVIIYDCHIFIVQATGLTSYSVNQFGAEAVVGTVVEHLIHL